MLLLRSGRHHTRPGGRGATHGVEALRVRPDMTTQLHHPVAVLDLDGTLVDSVYEHVVAWQRAFHRVGLHVGATRVHEAIGMGGDKLVAHVSGEAAEHAVGDDVRAFHDTYFEESLRTINALDGASELVEALAQQGRQVVVASSSPQKPPVCRASDCAAEASVANGSCRRVRRGCTTARATCCRSWPTARWATADRSTVSFFREPGYV